MRRPLVLALIVASCSCAPASGGGVDAATPDASTSSQGHDGLACTTRGSVAQDGASYAFCTATIGGTQLKIVEPAPGPGPLRLALYLHGDGAGPYESGLALRKHAPWTTTHRVLYAAVRAPNGCAWWLKPSYAGCDGTTAPPDNARDTDGENAAALVQVIDALRAGWDLADEPVLFGGSSGGAIFLASSFFPRFGDRYRGAYALSCGGDAPWSQPIAWDASKAAGSTLSFTYGDRDFLVPDIERAIAFYRPFGAPVDVKVVPETGEAGSSHCGRVGNAYSYDQLGRVAEAWAAFSGP